MIDINPIRINFYKYLNKDITISEFENWIYNNRELESELGNDNYLDLISFNFKSHDLKPFIKDIIRKCFDWNEYEKWRTIKLLTEIKASKIEIVLATRKMRELYLDQENEINRPLISCRLAIGFESVLDNCHIECEYHLFNSDLLKSLLEPISSYKNDIFECVAEELDELLNPDFKTIDLENIVTIDSLHEYFMEKLNFPDFYGKNWDAFWDSITGLVKMPKVLTIKNMNNFEQNFK